MKTKFVLIIIILALSGFNALAQNFSKGCYKVLDIDTDPSDLYAAISRELVEPLIEDGLDDFAVELEKELIIDGNRSISTQDCDNLKLVDHCLEALKLSEEGSFDNGAQYFDMLTSNIIQPLEDFGYNDLSKFLAYRLNPLNADSVEMSLGVCAAITELF